MKYICIFFLLFFLFCKKRHEKIINNIIKVDYVSTGKNYGKLSKPSFYVVEKIMKTKDCVMMIYIDTVSFKRIDTLKVYSNGKIIFNNIDAVKIDEKRVLSKSKLICVKKIYVPYSDRISADSFGGQIVFLTDDGILARYGTNSYNISLYKSNLYDELHKKILYQNSFFKRHLNESKGLP